LLKGRDNFSESDLENDIYTQMNHNHGDSNFVLKTRGFDSYQEGVNEMNILAVDG
tara:strand:- start:81 stop:245 length:165 start_codon:yes stop_codon:yes gene_type:complete